jgi:SAM-dependent methyltransferase
LFGSSTDHQINKFFQIPVTIPFGTSFDMHEDVKQLADALREHLKWWGLHRFDSDRAYSRWQREKIPAADLNELNRLIEERRKVGEGSADEAFYDHSARPDIAPVLYSQRYDYYLAVGPLVASRIADAQTILDFGCGIGVLTTFYARRFPDRAFLGVDRSVASVELARAKAKALGLANLRFERLDAEYDQIPEAMDLILSTHSLVQSEHDRGIPSDSWENFARGTHPQLQHAFEQRTGLGQRLDRLAEAVKLEGRVLLFEKTRPLARRIPLQRALAARDFRLVEPPVPVRYVLIDEISDDGPLYVVQKAPGGPAGLEWDETPEVWPEDTLYRCRGRQAPWVLEHLPQRHPQQRREVQDAKLGSIRMEFGSAGSVFRYLYLEAISGFRGLLITADGVSAGSELEEQQSNLQAFGLKYWAEAASPEPESTPRVEETPLYENHTVVAQRVWEKLPDRTIQKTKTFSEPDGRQMHIEWGVSRGLVYLYWANTFDQRQLVIMERERSLLLEQYYAELLEGGQAATPQR